MQQKQRWSDIEKYAGGSAEAERLIFAALARDLLDVQWSNEQRRPTREVVGEVPVRANLGVGIATLPGAMHLPEDFSVGGLAAGSEASACGLFFFKQKTAYEI